MSELNRYKVWARAGAPEDLSAAVLAGDLVLIQGDPAVARLIERARDVLESVFGAEDPQTAESRMASDAFRRAVAQARKAVAADAALGAIWDEILGGLGYAPQDVFQDRVRLRAVPSQAEAQARFARPLPIHRDSWGACIHAQINWWAPLYPLAETRTMLLWPGMFATPIANTSAQWDYDTVVSGRDKSYPLLPEALDAPAGAALPVVIEPGALLAFSAAHLHSGVSDESGRTRFSLDTRTVWAGDLRAGRGAPNVDCALKPPRWEMFEPAPDGALKDLAYHIENNAIGGAS